MIKKLRIKFICINMFIVTIMLCTILGLVMHFTHTNLENQNIQMLQELSSFPVKFTPPDMPSTQVRLPYFALQQRANDIHVLSNQTTFNLENTDLLEKLLKTVSNSKESTGIIKDYSLRFYRTNTHQGEQIFFTDISSEINTLDHLLNNCIAIGIGAFFAFLVISWLLAHWAIHPVEEAWTQQKQFVGDASHELKTPLTVITTNAELLLMNPCEEAAKIQFIQNILTMSAQMRGLTDSLLNLARIDNTSLKHTFTKVNISDLVSHTVLPFEPVFFEQRLELIEQIDNNLFVMGDTVYLRQIVEILLDNAQKYAYPQTVVHITLKQSGRKHCLLTVTNTGETIKKEDQKNIFKRFYRIDKARNMNHSYGLGLSIAANAVRQHKGKIWVHSANNRTTFYVQFQLLLSIDC